MPALTMSTETRLLEIPSRRPVTLTAGLAVCFLLLAAPQLRADEAQRVLILYSNESFLPANIALGNSLVGHMRAELPGRVEFFSEFLDLVRFSGKAQETRTANALRAKYAGRQIDLLIVAGPEALDLVATRRDVLFPGVPLVFTGLGTEELTPVPLTNATGIFMRLDPVPTLELALRLQPATRRVVVVTGASDFDKAWDTVAHERFRSYEDRLEFRYLSALPMSQLQSELRSLPPDSVVFYCSLFNDGDGKYYIPADAARLIASASAVPVYGLYDTYLGSGIVGGRMDTFELVGHETAKVGIRVLSGERPERIAPAFPADGVTLLDWRQMQRWGLNQRLLPPGSEVRFREASLWETHGGLVVAAVAVMAFQAALLIGLLVQRRNRRRAEHQAEQTRQELAHAARLAIVGELTASIAHEINQPLGAILSNADAAEMLLDSAPGSLDEVRRILEDIRQDDLRASEVIRRLRSLLSKHELELQPVDLNELIADVLKLLRTESGRRGMSLELDLTANLPVVRGDKVHLQQVLLNLLLNAMDAMAGIAGPNRVTVRSSRDANGSVEIAVSDVGCGIVPDRLPRLFDPFFSTKKAGMGLGLPIARSIVEAHGGRIWAENRPEGGARFRFTLPVRRDAEAVPADRQPEPVPVGADV